jgi:hypothetical protein
LKTLGAIAENSESEESLGGDDERPMPYPNEHACRLRPPSDFQQGSFRRINQSADGKQYSVIIGRLKGESKTTSQSFRYPKAGWTVAQARAHCKRHSGTFEPASGSSSSDSSAGSSAVSCSGPAEITLDCSLDLASAAKEGDLPKFSIVANTGRPMQVSRWGDPVIIDLSGVAFRNKMPVILDHDINRRFGHTTGVMVDDSKITATGLVSSTLNVAQAALADIRNGFPFQTSVGAKIEKAEYIEENATAEVNGREHKGPLVVARKTRLKEISVTVLGADDKTSIRISSSQVRAVSMDFNQWIESLGLDVEALTDEQRAKLEAEYNKLQAAAPVPVPPPRDGNKTTADDPPLATPDRLQASRDLEAAEIERQEAIKAVFRNPDYTGIETVSPAGDGKEIKLPSFKARAIREPDWTADRVELCLLRASRPVPASAPAAQSHTRDMDSQALTCALLKQVGCPWNAEMQVRSGSRDIGLSDLRGQCSLGSLNPKYGVEAWYNEKILEASDRPQYRNLSLHQLLDLGIVLTSGSPYTGNRRSDDFLKAACRADRELRAAAGGFSTLSVSNILENLANKIALWSYQQQSTVWRFFCAVRTLNDFKSHATYRLDHTGRYRQIGPDGELRHGELADAKFTLQADTYGMLIALTRQQMKNDDLGAFNQIPSGMGRMAAVGIESSFFVLLLSNPSSFFHADNSNLESGAGSDLGIDGLSASQQAFRDFVDANGNPILVTPDRILVGTQDEILAGRLFESTNVVIAGSTDAETPASQPHAGKFRPYVSSYLNNTSVLDHQDGSAITGQDSNQWYMSGNPNILPAWQMGFVDGRQVPVLESSDTDFATLGMRFRSYLDWGVGAADTSGMVKNAGA